MYHRAAVDRKLAAVQSGRLTTERAPVARQGRAHCTCRPSGRTRLCTTSPRRAPPSICSDLICDRDSWSIPLLKLKPMLERPKSEMTFNFMFEFINRAASMTEAPTIAGLNELMPYGDWRTRLAEAQQEERKGILIDAFRENVKQIGRYDYVVPTEVLRPLRDRTLYCLFYATRHQSGLAAFRECQTKALDAQAATRAALKLKQDADVSGQSELFTSLHDMGPNETAALRAKAKAEAEAMIVTITPKAPDQIQYKKLWAEVLTRHAVRLTDVNAICSALYKKGQIACLNWEERARVPKDHYSLQLPK